MATQRSIGGHIGRGLMILLAFALSVLLALIVLTALGSAFMGEELREGETIDGELGIVVTVLSLIFGGVSFLYVLTPTLTILPALVAVIIGEVAQIRSLLYYVVAGGIALAALPILGSPDEAALDTHALTLFATAGFAGGLFYWLLAGRNA